MSSEPSNLQERLEWATRRASSSGEAPDRETAELREAWNAWVECLHAADSQTKPISLDSAAWLDSVLAEPVVSLPTSGRSVSWSLALATALSLTVVGACFWLSQLAQPLPNTIARHQPPTVPQVAQSQVPTPAANTPDSWDWNDEIDQQLLEVNETLVAIRSEWRSPDRVDLLSEQMQELRSQWEDDSL